MLMATRFDVNGNPMENNGLAGNLGWGFPSPSDVYGAASGAVSAAADTVKAAASAAVTLTAGTCALVNSVPAITQAQLSAKAACSAAQKAGLLPGATTSIAPATAPLNMQQILAQRAAGGRISKYTGTIARYNTTRNVWSIYKPGGLSGHVSVGLGDACLFGNCGLGAAGDVTPAAPGAKIEELAAKPGESRDGGPESDGPAWYKNWKTYAIAGGVLAVAGGAWYVLK
jgi:hypothetical protein